MHLFSSKKMEFRKYMIIILRPNNYENTINISVKLSNVECGLWLGGWPTGETRSDVTSILRSFLT
jgi:hypothetical protein